MRIGMPTTSYPSRPGDAAGAFVRTLAVALARRGHRIDVIAPSVGRQQDLGDARVHVHRVRYAPRSLERTFGRDGAPDNLARDPLAWIGAASFPLALARAIAAHETPWHAIVSHFVVPTSLVAARFARGRTHVAVAHGTDAHVAASIPGLAARVRRSCTHLVTVSGALATRLGATDAIVQPMGIDRDETLAMTREDARARMHLDGFTTLSLSRLVPIKGIDVAIRASAIHRRALVVAGDGPERAALESLARTLDAPVRFVGHVDGDVRRALLAGCDAFVAPSRAIGERVEGTPTSVLEALAAGLPIVGTSVSGIGETVPLDAGLLAERSTPENVAAAIERLAIDGDLRARLGTGARRASAAFDVERVASRFERLLETAQGSTITASAGNAGVSAEAGMRAG
jgi:glycosyltransferase involved in cell wall biosynthesis